MQAAMSKRKFVIVLIKPSHYDDDGYVIQWRRSTIPSNSLASVYGLIAQCADEGVLGPDVDIEVEAYDECNTIIDMPGIAKRAVGAPSVWRRRLGFLGWGLDDGGGSSRSHRALGRLRSRGEEAERVDDFLDLDVRGGSPASTTITGSPGIGSSRVANWLLRREAGIYS